MPQQGTASAESVIFTLSRIISDPEKPFYRIRVDHSPQCS